MEKINCRFVIQTEDTISKSAILIIFFICDMEIIYPQIRSVVEAASVILIHKIRAMYSMIAAPSLNGFYIECFKGIFSGKFI